LAKLYRQEVEHLRDALHVQAHGREAFELVRSLIEEVRLVPTGGTLDIQLKGDLAGILAISNGAKADRSSEATALQIKVVAGARYHLYRTSIPLPPR
jgi:site-specific DNA recombinase